MTARANPLAAVAPRHRKPFSAAIVRVAFATVVLAMTVTNEARTAQPPSAPRTPSLQHPAAAPTASPVSQTTDPTPLLTFASTHHYPPVLESNTEASLQKQIARITFDLSKDPPAAQNCAQTLGARRFATQYDDLAQAYSNMGEHTKAVDAYAKAIGCNPRADFLHAELAASLLDLGRYADAREETARQLHLGRANFTLYTLLTQLDFIDEHWQDAIANARIAATMAPNDEQATYWQCFLWLAQLHVGSKDPVLATRHLAENWPTPILESLEGKITEEELVDAVSEEHDQSRQRDILSEALFYTGQQRLAQNRVDAAVEYFKATVNLKVLYFIEHQLATAELRKLRPAARRPSETGRH